MKCIFYCVKIKSEGVMKNGNKTFDANLIENGISGEEKIWENAKYALTWKGFMLKNDDGSVRIT